MREKKSKNGRQYYYSMIEFEEEFFPRSYSAKCREPSTNESIGIDLAKDSFKKAKQDLKKITSSIG